MQKDGSSEQTSSSSNGKGLVLVVDDEPQLAGMHAMMLEQEYEVMTAVSADEALEILTSDTDVVLIDRRMPGMSGDELARRIRAMGNETRIAMITAVNPDIDVLDVPFDAYIIKPVRKRDLLDIVDHLYHRQRYSAQVQELLTISTRLAAIETSLPEQELQSIEEYSYLRDRRDELLRSTHHRLSTVLEASQDRLVYRDLFGSIPG